MSTSIYRPETGSGVILESTGQESMLKCWPDIRMVGAPLILQFYPAVGVTSITLEHESVLALIRVAAHVVSRDDLLALAAELALTEGDKP